MIFDRAHVEDRVRRSADALSSLIPMADAVAEAGVALRDAVRRRATIYTCGNGGSAAQALHLAEELVGKYKHPRPPIPGLCLAADPTALTCIANDYGFEHVFSRQLEAFLRENDALVVLSTSGASENVVRALNVARERGALSIALLGNDGGPCRALADHPSIVPHDQSETIQEAHQLLLHLLVEAVESAS